MSDGGVADLDAYIKSTSQGKLACRHDDYKGRITVARERIPAGSVILEEEKLASVVEPVDNWLYTQLQTWHKLDEWELHATWTWAACCMILSSEEAESHKSISPAAQILVSFPIPRYPKSIRDRLLLLFSPEVTEESVSTDTKSCASRLRELIAEKLPHGEKIDAATTQLIDSRTLQRYANTWIFNCFEGGTDPLEYVTYFAPAFCSHSCLPNSLWHTEKEVYTLVARRDIEIGEEISFTYTSDGHLLEPTADRRQDLEVTKFFRCLCDRCEFPSDLSRGFRCQDCMKGQWFFGPEEPVLAEEDVDDVDCWLDIECTDSESEGDFEAYSNAIQNDSLYKVLDLTRRTNDLAQYINASVKPNVCTHCRATPGAKDVLRAKTLEYLLNLLTAKDDGEERYLLDSITDHWAREFQNNDDDDDVSNASSNQSEWWSAISFRHRLLPSVLHYVGQNFVLLNILDFLKTEIYQSQETLPKVIKCVQIKHILVTQMCPIYTGFMAWTSTDMVDLICWSYAEFEHDQKEKEIMLHKYLEIALEVGSTIFGDSSFTNDIKDSLCQSLRRVLPGGGAREEFVRSESSKFGLELESTARKMEGRFPQGVLLKRIVDTVKELVTEVNLDCNESGITLQAMDTSHVALVMLSLKLGAFDHYSCDHDRSLGLNIVQVSKIFRLCGNDDQVIIRNSDDPESSDKVVFIFDSAAEDRVSDFQLRIQQLDQDHLGVPDAQFAATVSMPSKAFAKIVNDLTTFSDSIGIVVNPKGIKFTAQGDFGSGNTLLKSRAGGEGSAPDRVEIQCEQSSVSLTFAGRYLVYFSKAASLAETVTLKMTPSQPLEVHFTLNDDPHVGYMKFYLAPKMDDVMS